MLTIRLFSYWWISAWLIFPLLMHWRYHSLVPNHGYMQCEKLVRFAKPDTCENWLGLVKSCVYYAHQTHEIYQLLLFPVDFKARGELWNLLNKTVHSKCSFIWNDGPVKIWNDHKAENLYIGHVNIFPNFWHWPNFVTGFFYLKCTKGI